MLHQLIGLSMILVLSACEPEGPLATLNSQKPSSELTQSFWAEQISLKPNLWEQALQICIQQARPTPNCQSVINTRDQHIQQITHYGSGHGFGPESLL